MRKNLAKFRFSIHASGQTDRQTGILIAILDALSGGIVINISNKVENTCQTMDGK